MEPFCFNITNGRVCQKKHVFLKGFKKDADCIYLSVCLSVCLSIYLSIYLFTYLSIYLFSHLSFYLSVFPSIQPSIISSIHPSFRPSMCLSVSLYVWLSILLTCLSVCRSFSFCAYQLILQSSRQSFQLSFLTRAVNTLSFLYFRSSLASCGTLRVPLSHTTGLFLSISSSLSR